MGSSNGGVPPGFRFHPTDEELLHYYLKKKVSFHKFDMEVIREVDLNKIEPWDLQEICKIGSTPQNEWYFFSHKDRKYPTGSRTNRATIAGFWKATGRDKCIRNSFKKIGMRKTLVFYRGRAPHGQKTDWIMHEYRLEDGPPPPPDHHHEAPNPNEEGWVVCRVFKKKNLFKVGNNNEAAAATGGGASTSSENHHLMMNSMMVNNNGYHDDQSQSSRDGDRENHNQNEQYSSSSSLLLHHHEHYPAVYAHIPNQQHPLMMISSTSHHHLQLQAQNFIPTHEPPLGATAPASASASAYHKYYSASAIPAASDSALVSMMQVKHLVSRDSCDDHQSGSTTDHGNNQQQQGVSNCDDDHHQSSLEVGTNNNSSAGTDHWGMININDHHDHPPPSSTVNHISLRTATTSSEMDFWGYAK